MTGVPQSPARTFGHPLPRVSLGPIPWAGAAVALIVLLSLPAFNAGGLEMDEGILVSYPMLISEHGLVPGRDFTTFYGPAQPYLLAGLGEVLELDQTLVRVTGLVYRVVLAIAVFALVSPLGRRWAAGSALAVVVVQLAFVLQGWAIFGGIAGAVCAFALLVASRRRPAGRTSRPAWRLPAAAGVCGAAAVAFRPDLAAAVLLAATPLLLWPAPRRRFARGARAWTFGFGVGLIPFFAWALAVGPDGLGRLIGELVASRPGRSLPAPGPLSPEGLGLLAAGTAIGLLTCAGARRLRGDAFSVEGRVLVGCGLLLLALLPTAIQRPDAPHVLPVAALALALSPLAVRDLRVPSPAGLRRLAIASASMLLLTALVATSAFSLRWQFLGGARSGVPVGLDGRSFRIADPGAAGQLNAILPAVRKGTQPGDALFVGTSDLTRTVYADSFVHYLLPELVPASSYIELNPGTANAPGSPLARELRENADALLLTSRWRADTARAGEPGPGAAEKVVDRDFCTAARVGSYEFLIRRTGDDAGPARCGLG